MDRPHLANGIMTCDERVAGCSASACRASGNIWVDTAVQFTEPDGSPHTLFCLAPDATPLTQLPSTPLVTPPMFHAASACMMSDDLWRRWTGDAQMPWDGTTQDRFSYCGINRADLVDGTHYRCDQIHDPTWASFTSASFAPVMCPKDALPEAISLFLPADATPEQLTTGRRILASSASAFSSVGAYSLSTRNDFEQRQGIKSLYYTCLPRYPVNPTPNFVRGPTDLTPLANGMLPFDPGIDPFGNTYTVAPGSRLLVSVGPLSGNVPVTSTASARVNDGIGGFVLTDLLLQQVGTASLGRSLSLSGSVASIDTFWVGDGYGAVRPIRQSSAALTTVTGLNGQRYLLPFRADSHPLTVAVSSGRLDLHGTFTNASTNTTYQMDVGLLESQVRPRAVFVSVGDPRPACTRFPDGMVGALFSLTGPSSTGSGVWTAASPNGYFEAWAASPSGGSATLTGTFRLPLESPSVGPGHVGLAVTQNSLVDVTYNSDLRVVDHVAPSVVSSSVGIPCDWETSPEAKCLEVAGDFTDNCSAPRAVIDSYHVYDADWQPIFTGDPKCPRPAPAVAGVTPVYYEIIYHLVDTWSNQSISRAVKFRIENGPPNGCAMPRVAVVLNDENL